MDYTTIQKWINKLQFPAFRLPQGTYFTTRDAITAWIFAAAEANREWKEERRKEGKRADNIMFWPARNLRKSLALRAAHMPSLEEIYAAEDARPARKAGAEEPDE